MDLINKEILAKNLKTQIAKSGKYRSEIAEELGVPYSTVTDWVNAKKYPRIDNIERLADYFGVSKYDLIEDVAENKKDHDRLALILIKLRSNPELLSAVEKMSELDQAKLESLNYLLDTLR